MVVDLRFGWPGGIVAEAGWGAGWVVRLAPVSLVDGCGGRCSTGWSWQGDKAGVGRGQFVGPGPGLGDAEVDASGGSDDAGRDVQEPVAQLLWFGQGMCAVE